LADINKDLINSQSIKEENNKIISDLDMKYKESIEDKKDDVFRGSFNNKSIKKKDIKKEDKDEFNFD